MVGGTSIGAFISGLYAMNSDLSEAVKLSTRVSQVKERI